jgi:hypothetical protein
MPDRIGRLQVAQQEIDKGFGRGYARDHADLTSAVMLFGLDRLSPDDDRQRPGPRGRAGRRCAGQRRDSSRLAAAPLTPSGRRPAR